MALLCVTHLLPMGVLSSTLSYSNPTQVMKRSRAFRRPYPAKASTPRNNSNRIAITIRHPLRHFLAQAALSLRYNADVGVTLG